MDDDEDVEWGEDTSDAAVARRMKDLSDAAKNLALSDDIEKTPQERIDMFYSYVKVTILVQGKREHIQWSATTGWSRLLRNMK